VAIANKLGLEISRWPRTSKARAGRRASVKTSSSSGRTLRLARHQGLARQGRPAAPHQSVLRPRGGGQTGPRRRPARPDRLRTLCRPFEQAARPQGGPAGFVGRRRTAGALVPLPAAAGQLRGTRRSRRAPGQPRPAGGALHSFFKGAGVRNHFDWKWGHPSERARAISSRPRLLNAMDQAGFADVGLQPRRLHMEWQAFR